jgi:hypothetical protein
MARAFHSRSGASIEPSLASSTNAVQIALTADVIDTKRLVTTDLSQTEAKAKFATQIHRHVAALKSESRGRSGRS